MKATDLMLGDYVTVKTPTEEKTAKVAEIYPKGIITEDGGSYLEDEIIPVPLTPEILEKNGWKKFHTYHILEIGGGVSIWFYWFESRLEREWRGIDEWNGHREVVETTFRSIGIEYIHQLQHALRLCGIEKEIIL